MYSMIHGSLDFLE